jgi:cell shape-determining protein MreC
MQFFPYDRWYEHRRVHLYAVSMQIVDFLKLTSTIARLIAIMLGRLEMTVDECIDAYVSMMDAVFKKKKHRFKNVRGELQARFDTRELEEAMKKIIKNSKSNTKRQEDLPMRNPDPGGCKT